MQRSTDLFKATTAARQEISGLYLKEEGSVDYKDMVQRFTKGSEEIAAKYTENLDEGQKAAFNWETGKLFTTKALKIGERARTLAVDDNTAATMKDLDSLISVAATDPELGPHAAARGHMLIQTMKSTGAWTATEAYQKAKKFGHDLARAEVDRDFASAGNQINVIDSLWAGPEESGKYPGIIGHERAALATQLSEKVRTEENRRKAEQREMARDAREATRERREQARIDGVNFIANNIGKGSADDLIKMGAKAGLPPGEISSLIALSDRVAENPQAELDAKAVLQDPDMFSGPDGKGQAKQWLLDHPDLSPKAKSRLIPEVDKVIDSRVKANSEEAMKLADKLIGSGIIKADDGKNVAWSQTREQVHALATTKRVTPLDLITIGMSHGLIEDKGEALRAFSPTPEFGDFRTPDGFGRYYLNLVEALTSGRITREQFSTEIERMTNYKQVNESPFYQMPIPSLATPSQKDKKK